MLETVSSHIQCGRACGHNIQVLQVAAGELLVGDDLDLAIGLLGDLDVVAEVASAALDLDAVVQELLEGLDVEDLVVDGLRAVDHELLRDLLALLLALGSGFLEITLYLSLLFCAGRCGRRARAQPSGQQSGVRTAAATILMDWK